MVQIGGIAALHERKTQALQEGQFNWMGFEQTVGDIRRDIQCGFAQEALKVPTPLNTILRRRSMQFQTTPRPSPTFLLTWHLSIFTWSLMVSKTWKY
jgi:hypothetical protein